MAPQALAFLLAFPLLAGCVGPGATVSGSPSDVEAQAGLAVPPSRLEAGKFYVFRHAGATLLLGVAPGGRAQLELFDGNDLRLGQISLSDALAGGILELRDLPAGEYVLRTLSINGTLRIQSAGAAPALRLLGTHIERQVLLQAPRSVPGLAALPAPAASASVQQALDLRFLRAPTAARLLVDGEYGQLRVHLAGAGGPVVASESSRFFSNDLLFRGLDPVPIDFYPENVRDGHLVGKIEAEGLRGAVVLEVTSYSRAEPKAAPARVTPGFAQFLYGSLPAGPVRFQVGPQATHLLLRAEPVGQEDRGWVALFDAQGSRLGTWPVPDNATLGIPVTPSATYIAARLRGNITLGANAAPADFDLHPLPIEHETLPAQAAGDSGEYGQIRMETNSHRVYAIEPIYVVDEPGQFSGPAFFGPQCGGGTLLRVAQENETLGVWDADAFRWPASPAATLVRDGVLQVMADGFGERFCQRPAVHIQRFQL